MPVQPADPCYRQDTMLKRGFLRTNYCHYETPTTSHLTEALKYTEIPAFTDLYATFV